MNKTRIDRLITEGLMYPAGLAKAEWAKQNGTWDALNEVSDAIIPPDLMVAF